MINKSRLIFKIISVILLWFFAEAALSSLKFSDRIEEFYLSNQLKVILIEDKRSPIVVSSLWYKVGSSYEREGISGISHVLEHMMFKGTRTTNAGEFSEKVKKVGGTENAFTGRDFTGYFQKVHKDHLEMCLKMESDRMRNLVFSQDEFKKEIEVVKEERRLRTDDQPTSKIFEKIGLQAFGMKEYGIPIVGTMEDLNKININDLKIWYNNYYKPSNAVLIIAGNFDRLNVKKLVDKYFAEITNSKTEIFTNSENHKYLFNEIIVEDKVSKPLVFMSFKNNGFNILNKKDHYAIELLMELMDGGYSSRFTKNLIDGKNIALNTFISYDSYSRKDNLITLGGTPRSGKTPEDLRDGILEEFKDFSQYGIKEDELQNIKSRLVANNIYKFDSVFYQAMQVGMLETKGLTWKMLDDYILDVNQITESDLIEAADKYILNNKFIFSVINPEKQ